MRKRWRRAELSRQNFIQSDLRLLLKLAKHNDYGPVLGLLSHGKGIKMGITSRLKSCRSCNVCTSGAILDLPQALT